jgi:hypothetical protein
LLTGHRPGGTSVLVRDAKFGALSDQRHRSSV